MNTRNLDGKSLFTYYKGDGSVPDGMQQVNRNSERGVYLADEGLRDAVRTAIALEKPLLVTGEPGTGKTALAWSVASELGLGPVLSFHTRSDHKGVDLLYSFDHIARFFDAQTRDPRALISGNYVRFCALGRAIVEADKHSSHAQKLRERFAQESLSGDITPGRRVVLVDEVDKAPRDFPNDLLDEIDLMEFSVREFPEYSFRATYRPIVIITSNSERQLPDPFLRRCVFHHLEFPDKEQLSKILHQRISSTLPSELIHAAIDRFLELRGLENMDKRPATAELEAWVRMLLLAKVSAYEIAKSPLGSLKHICALIKTVNDRRTLKALR